MQRRALSFEQARALQAEAEDLLANAEYEVGSFHALELMRDSDCSAYDREFVVLAMRLGVKPVTKDAKLLPAHFRRMRLHRLRVDARRLP